MKEIIDILRRIEDKADKLDGRLDNVDITLAKQAKDLEHHVKRTDILEDHVLELSKKESENTEHRKFVSKTINLFAGFLTATSIILGVILGVMQLIK